MENDDGDEQRMCYRKKAMPENYARAVVSRSPSLRAYQCPICSMWHITNDRHEDGEEKKGWPSRMQRALRR